MSREFELLSGRPLRILINRLAIKFGIDSDGEWEDQLALAVKDSGYVITEDTEESIRRAINTCESPIEKHLFPWLLTQRHWFFDYPTIIVGRDRLKCNCNEIAICPQLGIGQFRVDFALLWRHGIDLLKVVIECDGAEYHTDPKKDLDREKNLLSISHVVGIVRFTGSEIYGNPAKCAYRAATVVHGAFNAVRMKDRK